MKPILFNTDMVRKILDGEKTVTRRPIKPQPMKNEENPHRLTFGCWYFDVPSLRFPGTIDRSVGPYWPHCQTGDILYVRETWAVWSRTEGLMPKIHYKSDGENLPGVKWRPSIHMPKEAARIFLRVTDVRVERLQDISPLDVRAEGVSTPQEDEWDCEMSQAVMDRFEFERIWDSTIKPGDRDAYGWEADPWVWVIEFERCEKPIRRKT